MIRTTAIALAAIAALTVAACEGPAQKPSAPAVTAPTIPASADVYPFTIGTLQAAALKDGDIILKNEIGQIPWSDPALARSALIAAGQSGDTIDLSVQPLLLKIGERIVLIDTGAGGQMGTQNKLMDSLKAAGVDPGQITDILISHTHGDHIGGLVRDGRLTFPNATIRMSAPEWDHARAGAAAAGAEAQIAAIAPKVRTIEPGAQIMPSIKAVALNGHTPGHSGYEISDGDQSLLYVGDAVHSSVLSLGTPEWTLAWDSDVAAGVATREALVKDTRRVYAVHFPFPGLGRIEARGDSHAWVPEARQ